MEKINNVSIGIQARSDSVRFPRKIFELLEGKPLLQHLIDRSLNAARYANSSTWRNKTRSDVSLLIPFDDEVLEALEKEILFLSFKDMKANLFEGPKDSVVERYSSMAKALGSDYIVRLTGDCPIIPEHIIGAAIKIAVMNGLDYVSNIDERLRFKDSKDPKNWLWADGYDVEVMSRKALDWLTDNAKGVEREHVTIKFRTDTPKWARVGHLIPHKTNRDLKLSVDTPEDLESVRSEYKRILDVIELAEKISGKGSVFRV